MCRIVSVLFCVLLSASFLPAEEIKPVVEGPEGKRAFDDLARHYADDKQIPPYAEALAALKKDDAAARRKAGQYLFALLQQAFADEDNGRSKWQRLPYFGGGSRNLAREFRKTLAEAFGKEAVSEEALDAALWLINAERHPDGLRAGILALRRLKGPKVTAAFKGLLSPPHSAEEVLAGAIEEAGKRELKELGPDVLALAHHHRKAVREQVAKTAETLKLGAVPAFDPLKAFTPALEKQLRDISSMIAGNIPDKARWVELSSKAGEDEDRPVRVTGWLIATKDEKYRVLNWFGDEIELPVKGTTVKDVTLADTAARFKKLREAKGDEARDALGQLSRRGMLTGQFQPRSLSQPELLVSAWAWNRGDKKVCAEVLFSRLDDLADDRFLTEIARDLLGHQYHQEMLNVFSHDRNYPRALALAKHLSKPVFEHYKYYPRAKTLAAQLEKRGDDFNKLKLPTPEEWKALREKLARAEQIKYLADRMRLLNCIQLGQPGGIGYDQEQSSKPFSAGKRGRGGDVINPHVELEQMKLTVADLVTLAPYLADDNYMLAFSYWWDLHPDRTLHMVNWAIAELVNGAARRDLADLGTYFALDNAGKKAHIEKIVAWCKANANKTTEELLLDTLATTKGKNAFLGAAGELVAAKNLKALPLLIQRANDFKGAKSDIVALCHRLNTPDAAKPAREWVKDADSTTAFWAALILLRHGDRQEAEGLAVLQRLLKEDDGSYLYPRAIDDLLATKNATALVLAAGILKKKQRGTDFNREPILHRLFLAGRQEALDQILADLDSKEEGGSARGTYKGEKVSRQHSEGDRLASELSRWRTDGVDFEGLAPDEDRKAQRETLKKWLKEQFALIKGGKKPMMNTKPRALHFPEWRLDAP